MFVMKPGFSANHHQVRIRVQAFALVARFWLRAAADFHVFGKHLTGFSSELVINLAAEVVADRPVFQAFARHHLHVAIEKFLTRFRGALQREVFFDCITRLRMR